MLYNNPRWLDAVKPVLSTRKNAQAIKQEKAMKYHTLNNDGTVTSKEFNRDSPLDSFAPLRQFRTEMGKGVFVSTIFMGMHFANDYFETMIMNHGEDSEYQLRCTGCIEDARLQHNLMVLLWRGKQASGSMDDVDPTKLMQESAEREISKAEMADDCIYLRSECTLDVDLKIKKKRSIEL